MCISRIVDKLLGRHSKYTTNVTRIDEIEIKVNNNQLELEILKKRVRAVEISSGADYVTFSA